MKKAKNLVALIAITAITFLTACTKENLPGNPTGPQNPGQDTVPNDPVPGNPDSIYLVKVKAVITIGDINYDSIPSVLEVSSWDSSNTMHQRVLHLPAGTNAVNLPKAHLRYRLKLSQWGIADEMTFTKAQITEGTVISLGGRKAAKKLLMEESFLFASGAYHPQSKTIYSYNESGGIKQVDYYQKKPQHSDLKLYHFDRFAYNGTAVGKINRFDENGSAVGSTAFSYNAQGKIINMHQNSYGNETYASVEYSYEHGAANITIDYLYDNGQAMEYTMKFKGGNKTEDRAMSSTGGSEGGTYSYDLNINPFAHMNMPNIYLSNLSKNNMNGHQKGYGGSIPAGTPYRFEYIYDTEGYPIQLTKYFKSYVTGEDLYHTKTIYSY